MERLRRPSGVHKLAVEHHRRRQSHPVNSYFEIEPPELPSRRWIIQEISTVATVEEPLKAIDKLTT